jgi:putative transcriptional regulator
MSRPDHNCVFLQAGPGSLISCGHERTFVTTLTGQLLIAMPQMQDPRFSRSVVFICAHSAEGAMGIVVNKTVEQPSMGELLRQLGIEGDDFDRALVHFGGPVEAGRGFVLHSTDYTEQATLVVGGSVGLTATLDILRAIGRGKGPQRKFFALGYAGWGPGQLDAEIQANGWLTVPSDDGLLFDSGNDDKWRRAIAKLGVDPFALSGDAGHA